MPSGATVVGDKLTISDDKLVPPAVGIDIAAETPWWKGVEQFML